jgi:hypothetical protein
MRKRERSILLLFVSLISVSAWAQTLDLTISPTQFYTYDVENFITLRGAALGTQSTEVTYTNGDLSVAVEPQLDPVNPVLSEAWVPVLVAITSGRWAVRVVATDTDGTVHTYGPAYLDIVDRPVEPPTDIPVLPEVIVAEATSASGAIVTYDVGVTCAPASGSLFQLGFTTVTCNGGTFGIFVTDTTAPVVTVPASFFTTSHTPTFTASATDNLDTTIEVHCDPASGSTFPDGPTDVQCIATDAHANSGYGTFTITVITTPVLHLPDNITAEATGPTGAVVNYTATADGGDIQCSPPSGSTFPLGTTTVNCSATNDAGTATGSFTVTVQDTTPPTIVSIDASPREIIWPPNHKMIPITLTVVAHDAVDPAPHARIVSVSSDQPVDCQCGDGDMAPDWNITGDLTVEIRAERTAGVDRHYTITVTVTDFSGNIATGTIVIPVHP